MIKLTTICIVLQLALSKRWAIQQLDTNKKNFNGDIHEEVLMAQPKGRVNEHFSTHLCELKMAIYSLKKAPRTWNLDSYNILSFKDKMLMLLWCYTTTTHILSSFKFM